MMIFDSSTISARRDRVSSSLNKVLKNGDLVLFFCGEPIQKPGGLDQTYDFLPHPEYLWLTGSRRAGGVVAYSQMEAWLDFVPAISDAERIWEGAQETAFGRDFGEFEAWLEASHFGRVLVCGQPNTRQKSLARGFSQTEQDELQEMVNQVRRRKDQAEIRLIEDCARMALAGYQRIREIRRPGISEREIQIEYESAVFKAGAEKMPYGSIVGAGVNSAILHAVPTSRKVASGDLILVDAGADLHDYGVDITRCFAADGKLSARQKDIHDLVLAAQTAGIEKCRPGIEWHEVHRTAAQVMAEGLKSLGLMKGPTQDLLDSGAIAVFFPHGVGHMVGLRVRDVGPRVPVKLRQCCGVRVRVDLPLEEGFVMTVEPGLYFIPALLDRSEIRAQYADQIRWSEVEKWRDFGGIRLEDDILIQSKPVNLTALVSKEN